jgi:hypothetical protein
MFVTNTVIEVSKLYLKHSKCWKRYTFYILFAENERNERVLEKSRLPLNMDI